MDTPSELSSTKLQTLEDVHLAFIRHTGPYEQVSESLWVELSTWASRHRLSPPFILLGIGHDAPGITPPDKLRFDAAIRVPAPVRATGRIGYQLLGGRTFAVTTHVGPYHHLPEAYRELFSRLASRRDCRVVGLPVVEAYHTTVIRPAHLLNHTDIYIPVERIDRRAPAPRP